VAALLPLREGITISLDLRGMPTTFAKAIRRKGAKGKGRGVGDKEEDEEDEGVEGPSQPSVALLELDDATLRSVAWDKWQRTSERDCRICLKSVSEVSLRVQIFN
jgi:hypothetical protein